MPSEIRLGVGAGFAADRIAPAVDMARTPDIDYLIFECLAERTIALAQLDRLENPDRGYNPWLENRMTRVLPYCVEHGTTIITNMGAVNPEAAAKKTKQISREMGCGDVSVAVVSGSNVLDSFDQLHPTTFGGEPIEMYRDDAISANAYLGAEAIVDALDIEADVVITDRVSDVALFLAPLLYEFGWDPDPEVNPELIGQGIATGHLLECSAQVTGGFFADPGKKDVEDLTHLGFPYAIVSDEGDVEITKLEETGGEVSQRTCKEQLLYEIGDPSAYITPDGIADFTNVSFEQVGPDRICVENAVAEAKPETLKVTVGYEESHIGEGELSYGGPNALARAELALSVVEERLRESSIEIIELHTDLIGIDSLHGGVAHERNPNEPYEVRIRVAGRCPTESDASDLTREVRSMTLNGPAAGGGGRRRVTRNIAVISSLIDRENVTPVASIVQEER